MPVVFLALYTIAEADHGGDGITSLEIGVVETFDMYGKIRQLEVFHQLLQHLPAFVRRLSLQLKGLLLSQFLAEIGDIFLRELEQLSFVAAPGYGLFHTLF